MPRAAETADGMAHPENHALARANTSFRELSDRHPAAGPVDHGCRIRLPDRRSRRHRCHARHRRPSGGGHRSPERLGPPRADRRHLPADPRNPDRQDLRPARNPHAGGRKTSCSRSRSAAHPVFPPRLQPRRCQRRVVPGLNWPIQRCRRLHAGHAGVRGGCPRDRRDDCRDHFGRRRLGRSEHVGSCDGPACADPEKRFWHAEGREARICRRRRPNRRAAVSSAGLLARPAAKAAGPVSASSAGSSSATAARTTPPRSCPMPAMPAPKRPPAGRASRRPPRLRTAASRRVPGPASRPSSSSVPTTRPSPARWRPAVWKAAGWKAARIPRPIAAGEGRHDQREGRSGYRQGRRG